MNIKKPEQETLMVDCARPVILTDRIFSRAALKISLIYLVFGILWILFSDNLFLPLAARQEDMILVSSVKGILFIVVTTVLLFFLVQHYSRQLRDANTQLRVQYDALVLSQEEWESTFNAISDWISLITPEGQVLRSNKAIERLFGVPAGEIIGRNCFELVHGEECLAHECPRRRMLVSRRREITELPVRDGTGWVQVTVDPVTNAAGDVVSAVHIVRDISERMRSEKALEQAKKKLHILNYVTFNDIQNMVYTVSGYQQLAEKMLDENPAEKMLEKEDAILRQISHSLNFARSYQDLGLKPPQWQDVNHVFLLAISHLDFLRIHHTVLLDNLEIFADPLLEQVFQILADNILVHGETATQVKLGYTRGPESVTLFFKDDGIGIPEDTKARIFLPEFQNQKSVGLFLAREILEVTGISIRETGIPGSGARFEITVPKGAFRFAGAGKK
jgi:PAS domain S-box-containing protein